MSLSIRSFLLLSVLAVLIAFVQGVCDPSSESKCLTVVTTTPAGSTLSVNFVYDVPTGTICSLIAGSVGQRTPAKPPTGFISTDNVLTLTGTVVVSDVSGFVEATNLAVSFTTGLTIATQTGSGSLGMVPAGSASDAIVDGYQTPSTAPLATLVYNGLFTIDQVVQSTDTNNDCGAVTGDPVFRGFFGQLFSVKGEGGRVFNLLSSQEFSFNNRFVSLLSSNDSMTYLEMRKVRAQQPHSKLLNIVSRNTESSSPPVTAAWNHPGTYLGECGLRLGESQLYVAPGAYAHGFASITMNGVNVPVSSTPIELDGDMTVVRPSAFKVTVATRDFHFTIVNSDHFINIEHVALLNSNAQLSGLLGQTAAVDWEVMQSADWKAHLETDFKLASNSLFGADFEGQQF